MRRWAWMMGGVVVLVVILIAGRSIWPYLDVHDPSVVEGWSVETVTEDLGGPTCLIWQDADHLLVCDRDGDRIHRLTVTQGDGGWEVERWSSWLEDLDDLTASCSSTMRSSSRSEDD